LYSYSCKLMHLSHLFSEISCHHSRTLVSFCILQFKHIYLLNRRQVLLYLYYFSLYLCVNNIDMYSFSSSHKNHIRGILNRRNISWRSFYRNTEEFSRILNGYHRRGMWRTKYSCFQTPHYWLLGFIDNMFYK
jgi:hypothetical protein